MLQLESYSDKSFVIRGDKTKEYKEQLKEFGGKWNSNLKDGCGWIFPNKNKDKIQEWVESLNNKNEAIDNAEIPDLKFEKYSEKSFVIRGEDTKKYKEKLKEFGGKWNSNLKNGGGWIFSNNNETKIKEWFAYLNIDS